MPSTARTPHRRHPALAATGAAALAAVVLLAGCGTGTPAPAGSTTATTASATASASAPASASAGSTASPSATSTVGALVPGFPAALLPLMPGATLKSSSYDATGAKATAALVADTAASTEAILAFYTKALGDQGFTPLPGDAVGSVPSKDFTRANGTELVNLSMVPGTGTVTFTLSANVLPASLK
ncbi:hypothetical protein ACQCSX_00365 [Pseudarthrobacter sp. P1]|uniref:hypothetical protein n=1 Tax=Pseudarthrobacter sp. P1 TaxID=3418418 RepID=UPI003CF072BE